MESDEKKDKIPEEKKEEKKDKIQEEKKEEIEEGNKIKQLIARLKAFISLNKDGKLNALEQFFEDLNYIFENNYYYLVHSINLPNLVELYIESSLDDNINDKFKYSDIFEELKCYCFIPREYIISIYQYFSDIFHRKEKIIENDKNFLKFPKVVKLWEIFYHKTFKVKSNNPVVFSGDEPFNFSPEEKNLRIVVILNCPIIKELNENLVLLELQFEDNNVFSYSYKDYFKDYKEEIKSMLHIEFNFNKDMEIQFDNKKEKTKKILEDIKKKPKIKNIKILEKFYGEILSIFSSTDILVQDYLDGDHMTAKKYRIFINYHDTIHFNIYNYFNGLKPFAPFPLLIKGLNENKNIEKIGKMEKKDFLKQFVQKIFDVLVRFCEDYNIDSTYLSESDKISVKKIYHSFIF